MPELPEVETVVRILQTKLIEQTIQGITINWAKTVENSEMFIREVVSQTIKQIDRRGKYIQIHLERGVILVHLRMEGKFFIRNKDEIPFKHTHVILHLNTFNLEFNDTRKFGRMMYITDATSYLNTKLGLEPFDENLNETYLALKAQHRTIALKTFLLDQSVIAGIGNIYSDEICFQMKINPRTSVAALSTKDWQRCIKATREILMSAIHAGGTSVRSYTSSLGITGLFQLNINVYGRHNQPCHTCHTPLIRTIINQRSSVYCPKCQKE